jgi:competence protein ComEC
MESDSATIGLPAGAPAPDLAESRRAAAISESQQTHFAPPGEIPGIFRKGLGSWGGIPLFHAASLFALGIAAARFLLLRPSVVLLALALTATLCIAAALRAQRIAWLPLGVLWCLLGVWCAEMEPHPAPAPVLNAFSDGLLRTVEGTIVDAGPVRGEMEEDLDQPSAAEQRITQRIDVRVSTLEQVTDEEDVQIPADGGLRLTVRWNGTPDQPFHCGERVRAVAQLLPPEVYHDPGVWNRQDYLLDQGITSTASIDVERVERIGSASVSTVAPYSARWRAAADSMHCRLSAAQRAASTRLLALPAATRALPAPFRLSQDDAIMLAAMVTGDRTFLSHSLRVGFERTGSFHMLVVSGFHLAIVAGCIFWFAKRLRLPRLPATLLTIAASFGYALFTGFATPVQRSLWMVTLYLLGRLVYRDRSPMNTIGFAALCLLVASPRSLFDSGFQMTLLAVVAIGGIATPLLQSTLHTYLNATRDLRLVAIDVKLFPRLAQFRVILRMLAAATQAAIQPLSTTTRAPESDAADAKLTPKFALFHETLEMAGATLRAAIQGRLAESFAWDFFPWAVRFLLRVGEFLVVSFVVELVMTLPMAIYFHRVTIFALPVNLFILPLLVAIMPAALVTLLALVVWPAAAVVPAAAVALLLHFGVRLVHLFGSLALGDFRIPGPLFWQSALFCALLGAAIAIARGGKWQRRAAWGALICAAVAAVAPRPVQHPRDALLVEAIDVGQGDSLLLIAPDGKTMLVDGGGFGGGPLWAPHSADPPARTSAVQEFDIGEEVVSAALWSRGIRRLDVVALSHAHSDHMGGLPSVLRNFHPAELWVGNNPRTESYDALLHEAADLRVRLRSLRAGDALHLGNTDVAVLAPMPSYRPGPAPANNDSLVLRVAYGQTSVLLEGDAEAPIEQAMLAESGLSSTLLKVGHHGSVSSTRPEFLARVAPQWAVISCGLHNRYGHPRPEVLTELQQAKVRTFSTDIQGAICFRLDGKTNSAEVSCASDR